MPIWCGGVAVGDAGLEVMPPFRHADHHSAACRKLPQPSLRRPVNDHFAGRGRREERRWRWEALTEALVAFLDTSFRGPSGKAFEARVAGENYDEYRQNAIDSHAEMPTLMTGLRMLARQGW